MFKTAKVMPLNCSIILLLNCFLMLNV